MNACVAAPVEKRKRKRNFSTEEENVIQTMVEKNHKILTEKLTNDSTNKKKQAIWADICQHVNIKGVEKRSVDEIKEKWTNMTRKAKTVFTEYRKNQRKTGGGPPPPEPSQTTNKIIDMLQDTAGFSGVPGGVETDIGNVSLDLEPVVLLCDEVEDYPDDCLTPHCGASTSTSRDTVEETPTCIIKRPLRQEKTTPDDVFSIQRKESQLRREEGDELISVAREVRDRELFELKKTKLKLQISVLQKLNNHTGISPDLFFDMNTMQ